MNKRWWFGEWQSCSATCDDKEMGMRQRSVLCVVIKHNEFDADVEIIGVPTLRCDLKLRPVDFEKCEADLIECENSTGFWIKEEWSQVKLFLLIRFTLQ